MTMRDDVIKQFEKLANDLGILRDLVFSSDLLEGAGDKPNPPARVLFCSPVTGVISDTPNVWGADWFDATGYATYYTASGAPAYHTGADLNRPSYADADAPIYAAALGTVVFSGDVSGWQGGVIVLRHALEDGSFIWTRYAHIIRGVYSGQVQQGERIGRIADYNKDGPRGDHLHYDIAKIDLGAKPGDWPGLDKARLLRDYADPVAWHKGRMKDTG